MRPVGRQINEVVLDNDSAGVTFTGSVDQQHAARATTTRTTAPSPTPCPYRFASTTTRRRNGGRHLHAEHPAGRLLSGLHLGARTARTARRSSTASTTPAARREIRVDHSMVGNGWVYLGTYHFNAGSSTTLRLGADQQQRAGAGSVVIADAIRFGNGMGDFIWTASGAPAISGYPREDENSLPLDLPARSASGTTPGDASIGTRQRLGAVEHGRVHERDATRSATRVYIGFHSNAGGGRGARRADRRRRSRPHAPPGRPRAVHSAGRSTRTCRR